MTAVPESNKITAEEYFNITESSEERTELRNGTVTALAQPTIIHQQIATRFHAKVDQFIRNNKGTCTVLNAVDVQLTDDTVVVPDVLIVCDPSKMDERRCYGAPDWVVEILSTNRRDDLVDKLVLYQNAGVREYWIVDPKNEKTLVYFFERNDLPDIYTFDTPIPVEIYDRKLEIRIADLV